MTGRRRARGLAAAVTSAGIVIFALAPASSGAAVRHQLKPPASARGPPAGPIGSGGVLSLQVAGVHGVPTAATAVILNVAVVGPTAGSFLTIYPDGQDKPATSNINVIAGQTIAGEVVVPVFDGKVDFWNHGGSINLVADLPGYYLN